jgi:hypothetical protein
MRDCAGVKVVFNKDMSQQIGFEFTEEGSEMLHLEHSFAWC